MAEKNESAETAKAPAERLNPKSAAGTKVTVACRLPHGMVLHLDEMIEQSEVVPQGYRTVKIARKMVDEDGNPLQVTLNGTASPHGVAALYPVVRDANGQPTYALTSGISKDFWDRWLEANKTALYVKNGQVFAFEKEADAVSQAKEFAGRRSGLEPIVPDGDRRAGGMRITEEDTSKSRRKAA